MSWSLLVHCTFDFVDGPSIVVPPSDAEVLVGSTATFMCEASGNPPASISWSRDGVAVADNFVSNNGGVLTVSNAQPRDSVTYTCTATNTVNDLGRWSSLSTNASAHLRVIGRHNFVIQARRTLGLLWIFVA